LIANNICPEAALSDLVWTPEKNAEYDRLYSEFAQAVGNARRVLKTHGMSSVAFRRADAAAGEIWVKMRAMQGKAGKHWMA
jgi:hypothetical protein